LCSLQQALNGAKKEKERKEAEVALAKVTEKTRLVIHAVESQQPKLLTALMSHRNGLLDINAQDSVGRTALMYAVRNNDEDMVQHLFTGKMPVESATIAQTTGAASVQYSFGGNGSSFMPFGASSFMPFGGALQAAPKASPAQFQEKEVNPDEARIPSAAAAAAARYDR